jgi:hypothetical protein
MEDLVFYCKSYKNDVQRVKTLLESINKHNKDNIPFYVSTPLEDKKIFTSILGTQNWIWIDDNDINPNNQGWLGQQIVKSSFWKLGICKNYLCLDSDTYFIKSFSKNDFLVEKDIPYTVIHEQKELLEWASINLSFDISEGFQKNRIKIMKLLGRKGKIYDFGPSPFIWSKKVWEDLESQYIEPNNLDFSTLLEYSHSELTWYGEALLAFKSIPLHPIQPIMKVYHYKEQYIEDKNKGVTEETLSQNYLGIIMQSNWGAPLKY